MTNTVILVVVRGACQSLQNLVFGKSLPTIDYLCRYNLLNLVPAIIWHLMSIRAISTNFEPSEVSNKRLDASLVLIHDRLGRDALLDNNCLNVTEQRAFILSKSVGDTSAFVVVLRLTPHSCKYLIFLHFLVSHWHPWAKIVPLTPALMIGESTTPLDLLTLWTNSLTCSSS